MDKNLIYFHIHLFFIWFSLSISFSFGAIVIYNMMNSVFLTLVYYLINYIFICLIKTLCIKKFMGLINYFKFKFSMLIGAILFGSSLLFIFYLPNDIFQNFFVFSIVGFLIALGANLYFIPSDYVKLSLVGKSKTPGSSSAVFTINSVVASLLSVFLALYLIGINNINLLYFFSGLSFLLSFLFLFQVQFSFKKLKINSVNYLKSLSLRSHLASMELNHELYNIALPLVILSFFGSINKSIIVVAISAIGVILFVQLTGKLKDLNNNFMIYLASFMVFIGWLSYFFIDSAIQFIIVGILISGFYKLIQSTFEARLGRKMANGSAFEKNLAYDFSKILGRIIIILILIGLFLIYGYIPKETLILGSFFIIPKILFVLKDFDKLKV